jgi:hypothetical protein
MPWSAFAQSDGSQAAPQCEDIVLADGTLAECPSVEASQTAAIAHAHQIDITCPAPTRQAGKRGCVLDRDEHLDAPLKLESFTRLDCGGYALLPKTDGQPLVGTQKYVASTPEIAILLIKAYGVTIQNCRIGSVDHPFDFGVVVLGSKLPAEVLGDQGAIHQLRNKIQNNAIAGRYTGVLISQADNTAVADNQVDAVIGTRAGTGIDVLGDSDLNQIKANTVTTHTRADASAVNPLYPGAKPSPRVRPIGIRQNLVGGAPAVTNICLGGELVLQIAGSADAIQAGSHARQEDNVVEGNFLDCGNIAAPFCIATATGAVRPRIAGNTIVGAHQGLHFSGIAPGDTYNVAGHCHDDPLRACSTTTECNKTDPCGNPVSKGACEGVAALTNVTIGATDPLVVGNTVDGTAGKVEIGMYVAVPSPHATIVGNTVRRASLAGIRLNNQSLENTTVTGNTVVENRFGLVLAQVPIIGSLGSTFGSAISLNDFVGSTRQAIGTGFCKNQVTTSCEVTLDGINDCPGTTGPCVTNTMPFVAELSVDGKGNYWGRPCYDSNGFRGAIEPDAQGKRDTSASNVNDSHPYGVPIAAGGDDTTLTCQ